jgi:hypothetical protein
MRAPLALTASVVLLVLLAPAARAGTFTVETTGDTSGNPADCTMPAGTCTPRASTVAPRAARPRSRPCTRWTRVRAFAERGRSGRNAFRMRARGLRRGRYRLVARPTGGKAAHRTFRVVRSPRRAAAGRTPGVARFRP